MWTHKGTVEQNAKRSSVLEDLGAATHTLDAYILVSVTQERIKHLYTSTHTCLVVSKANW